MTATKPLQPFSPPTALLSHLPGISAIAVVQFILYCVFILWAIYTLIIIYHWVKYSRAPGVAFKAIVLHLVISLGLMVYAFAALSAL